ncbi:MAG: flagellar biosynthesis protein FlhF, partial [Proteobacteria bacterium]|nr:flagellar biosynthesis protein FlhF [Pseudomonadota bacterium]
MNVKRYIAPTARECLRKVKEELGPDAIVVSNKPVAGGVEIMAMTADGFEALSRQAAPQSMSSAAASRTAANKAETLLAPAAAAAQPQAAARERAPAAPAGADDDYTVSLSSKARKQPIFHPSWQVSATAQPAAADSSRQRPRPLPSKPEEAAEVLSEAQVSASLKSILQEAETAPLKPGNRSPADLESGTDGHSPTQVVQLVGEMQTIKALLERQLAGFAWGEMSREAP